MFEIVRKIEGHDSQAVDLVSLARSKGILCGNFVDTAGDHRYWDVQCESYDLLREFREAAIGKFREEVGRNPSSIILMLNHVSATRCPGGSGGGWHVDSVRSQYKMFMYLTDCESKTLGPLTLLTSGFSLIDRAVVYLNYIFGGRFRFSDKAIQILKRIGFKERPFLLQSCIPFFVNTSYIHRGGEISAGDRVMVTVYMFDKDVPESIRKRIANNEYN